MTPNLPESWTTFFGEADEEPTAPLLDVGTLAPPPVVEAMTRAVTRGRPAFLPGAAATASFDLAWFRRAARSIGRRRPPRSEIRACFSRGPKHTGPMMGVTHDQIGPLTDAGATVCVSNIHLADARLAAIASYLKVQIGFSGLAGAHCYFSPAGSGFHTHWDARMTAAVQLVGRKTWRYAHRPAARFPLCNAVYDGGRAALVRNHDTPGAESVHVEHQDQADFTEVTLEPGDVLVLPAGTWHSAEAGGCSLAFNLYLQHQSFAASVADWITEHFAGDERWRGGMPVGALQDAGTDRALRDYVQARTRELVEALGHPDGMASSFERAWLRQVTGGVVTNPAPTRTEASELEDSDHLVVDRSAPIACRLVDGPDGRVAVLARGEYELSLDPAAYDLLDQLCRTDVFRAGDACGWRRDAQYAWEPVKALLSACERAGIVSRRTPSEVRA